MENIKIPKTQDFWRKDKYTQPVQMTGTQLVGI